MSLHRQAQVLHVLIQIMCFSLVFSSTHLGALSGYHRATKWVCLELKPWPGHSPQQGSRAMDSAKSAFGHPSGKGDTARENPGLSDILQPTQHH